MDETPRYCHGDALGSVGTLDARTRPGSGHHDETRRTTRISRRGNYAVA
jgi:hypothetical protein